MKKSFLQVNNLVIGGDLKFSMGQSEIWGTHAQQDHLSDYFSHMIESNHLVHICLTRHMSTWRNRRTRYQTIARRNNQFFIRDTLLENIPLFRKCVGIGGVFDHFPIYLELAGQPRKPKSPFKFNGSWFKED